MSIAAISFAMSLIVALSLTPFVRAFANRWGFVDHVGASRKIHSSPIPRLGGIAIIAAFFAPIAVIFSLESPVAVEFFTNRAGAVGLLIGGGCIAAIGVIDDIRGVNALVKLGVQVPVAVGMCLLGFQIDLVANPFGHAISLGWLAIPVTVIWIVGITNAINLIDGLDGLAAGVSLFATAVNFAIALIHHNQPMIFFSAILAGAIIGFLVYNFNPATIFMGDSGSMFLGFILATTSLQVNQKSSTAVALLIPIIALGLPIADTLLAFARRTIAGRSPFAADRGHLHHRLLDNGFSHRQAAVFLYVCCFILAIAALTLTFANSATTALLLGLLLVATGAVVRKFSRLPQTGPRPTDLSQTEPPEATNDKITRAAG